MVLYDPKRSWSTEALCAKLGPEYFFAPHGQVDRPPTPTTKAYWAEAKEVCSRCPVLEQCRRDTLGEEYGVWGGRDEHQRYVERTRIAKKHAWKKWPEALRVEWGQHLAELRSRSMHWRDIQHLTGLTISVCEGLIAEWEQHAPAPEPEPVAEVIELPAPAAPRKRQPWPKVPGDRHAWVRNNGLIADGWYAGHTEDGRWVRMQVFSGRGNVIKFFPVKDVRFYYPQSRWTVPYVGRPDAADDVQEDAHAARQSRPGSLVA